MTTDRIRIVVADDHDVVRAGMRHLFDASDKMIVIGAAADGAETLELIERLQPDVLTLDILMPKVSGIEVAGRAREVSSGTRILAVSAYDDDDYIVALIEAGAAGYMMKSASPDRLLDAVERVHGGEFVLHPVIAQRIAEVWAERRVIEKEAVERLTARELQVVRLAARGMRNKAIAAELSISVRSVEAHLRSIFVRLGVSSRMQAVLYAVSNNLISDDQDDNA